MPDRAEIEAVARALSHQAREDPNVMWPNWTSEATVAIRTLDRVRDARDDDEGRVRDENAAALDALADHPKCGKLGARSPQGEDHGPEPDALGGLPPSQPKEDQ